MQHLLLLHGAIGSSEQLKELAELLQSDFIVHVFDFPGHGGKALPPTFSIEYFAESVMDFLKDKAINRISIFGYSMGGYVAMYLAKHHPGLVVHVITLATKFDWDETIAAKEVKMLQPDVINTKLPAFAETLQLRHFPTDWKFVLNRTAEMLTSLGKNNTLKLLDYATISTQCLVMIGDRDKMVSLDETVAVYRQLPEGQLAVLPSTPHPIEQVNIDLLANHLRNFILNY